VATPKRHIDSHLDLHKLSIATPVVAWSWLKADYRLRSEGRAFGKAKSIRISCIYLEWFSFSLLPVPWSIHAHSSPHIVIYHTPLGADLGASISREETRVEKSFKRVFHYCVTFGTTCGYLLVDPAHRNRPRNSVNWCVIEINCTGLHCLKLTISVEKLHCAPPVLHTNNSRCWSIELAISGSKRCWLYIAGHPMLDDGWTKPA
jgi:hypothetical protein